MTERSATGQAVEPIALPETGFVRIKTVLAVIPVSVATWYRWINAGKAPKPVPLGENIAAWRAEDIRALIKKLGAEQ